MTDVLLGVGPHSSDWQNSLWTIKRGCILTIPLLVIYIWQHSADLFVHQHEYLLLALTTSLVSFLAYWLVVAFFFGYFFGVIRGQSGIKKGLWLALMVIICSAVSDLPLIDQALQALQIIYFLTGLGFWMDYENFRDATREEFQWTGLFQFETGWTRKAFGASMVSFVLVPLGLTVLKEGMSVIIKEIFKRLT